jgi:hypothetical protein
MELPVLKDCMLWAQARPLSDATRVSHLLDESFVISP